MRGRVEVGGANYRCWRKPQLAQRGTITQYRRMIRALIWLGVSIVITTGACGGGTATPATSAIGAARASANGGPSNQPPVAAANATPGSAAGATCAPATCVFHAGVAGYYSCLAGAAGACTHFGGSCVPTDRCMFDAPAKLYKHCSNPVDGTCETFGATCNPAPGCWFDAKDGLFRTCTAAAGGMCSKWGELCSPAKAPA